MAKKIYLSPSDQNRNIYAYGDTNEMTQCGRIADACEIALKRCGFEVKNNQSDTMEQRVMESNAWGADLHVPIHTNAFNGTVSGTRMFYYSESSPGKSACVKIFSKLAPITPGNSESIKVYPELYELRVPNAASVYIEAEFHDVPETAKWIVTHVVEIGEAICEGICDFYGVEYVKNDPIDIGDGSDWSAEDREWAIRNGLIEGDEDGFRWYDNITREELIAVLHRFSNI